MMSLHSFVILLPLISSLVCNPVNSATFENVTVSLTTQLEKLFFFGRPPLINVHIQSSDTLGEYINLQPLEIVVIQDAQIPRLKQHSVSNLPNTVYISIISCGIKDIEPGAFQNLPRLEGLNLERNVIEEVRDGVFTGLRLKTLDLSKNVISRLGRAAFNNMTMTSLVLNNNKISRWNSDWFLGTPVGSIYMSNNLLEEVPANAFNFGLMFKRVNVPLTAWHIVLSQNRIRKVHPDAFNHVNGFMYLSLADNYLEELPKNVFDSVKNIHSLDLTNNRIGNVDGLFDDINIQQLVLINNTLSCFPTEVFDVSNIHFIFLDGNPLTCGCVAMWKDFQARNDAWVVYNMKNLEDNCVEKN